MTPEIVVIGAGLTALLMAFMTRFMGWSVRRERDALRLLPLFALYHPASIIYRRTLAPVYERDVLTLAENLR